jgi:hypothetical protein
VHLPSVFAQDLFDVAPMGMTVVVADEKTEPAAVVHPAVLAPVDPQTGREVEVPPLSAAEEFRWQPERAATGPLSILISAADQRVLVYRNAVEIGRAHIAVQQPQIPLGTHAFIMLEGLGTDPSVLDTNAPAHRWIAIGIPGHAGEDKQPLDPAEVNRVRMPPQFTAAVYAALAPGTTLLVTDAAVLEHTTGRELNVLNADPPVTN